MANAKRCDTCGKFYTQDDKKFTTKRGSTLCGIAIEAESCVIKRYDVCDECAEKIYNLIEGGCLGGKE